MPLVAGPKSDLTPVQAMVQLKMVTDTLKSSPDLERCLLSPSVPRAKKEAVVSNVASQLGAHRLIQNFLRLVVHHRRVHDLPGVRGEFEKIIDERTGFQRADIVSAVNLADNQKLEIVGVLERASGKKGLRRFLFQNRSFDFRRRDCAADFEGIRWLAQRTP